MANDDASETARRIYWKCRRGMLELDVIFLQFYQKKFIDLSPAEQQIFSQLLDEYDPVLYAWIFGKIIPNNPDYQQIIQKIQENFAP